MATWFVVCLCLSGDNKKRYVSLLRYVDMYIGISVFMLAVVFLVENQVAACLQKSTRRQRVMWQLTFVRAVGPSAEDRVAAQLKQSALGKRVGWRLDCSSQLVSRESCGG